MDHMKKLSLLRHAKSGEDVSGKPDFDRPLNERGHKAAIRMGRWMAEEGIRFDRILASPAVRIRETLAGVAKGYGAPLDAEFDRNLYLASPADLMDRLHDMDDRVTHLLLVGHSPGIEELLLSLTSAEDDLLHEEVSLRYPTAAYARLRFSVANWADVRKGEGMLVQFMRPRDLDPSLGPESEYQP